MRSYKDEKKYEKGGADASFSLFWLTMCWIWSFMKFSELTVNSFFFFHESQQNKQTVLTKIALCTKNGNLSRDDFCEQL